MPSDHQNECLRTAIWLAKALPDWGTHTVPMIVNEEFHSAYAYMGPNNMICAGINGPHGLIPGTRTIIASTLVEAADAA